MSQENIKVVRRMLDAYSTRENRTALQSFDPEVEFDMTFRPDGGIFHGREGVAEAMRIWTGTFDEWEFHVEELIDAGERVLTVLRESGRGKGSGILIEQATFLVATLRNNKLIRMEGYLDRNDALEAVGLRE